MALDMRETERTFDIEVDVPGVPKEEIKVEVNGRVLSISYEHKEDKETQDGTAHVVERFRGSASRAIQMPKQADLNNFQASAENGVLKITVPKMQPPESEGPKKIEIK